MLVANSGGLRIGVDARSLSGKLTGVGRYVLEILQCMPEFLPDVQWILYSRGPIDVELPSGDWRVVVDQHPLFRRIPGSMWVKTRLGYLMSRDKLDVVWAARTLAPNIRVPLVTTVFDLNHRLVPETMEAANRIAYSWWHDRDVLRADQVISISNGTAMRLHEAIGRTSDGIALPGARWANIRSDEESALIDRPYVLSVATREPRKNLNNLVQAFAHLKDQGHLEKHLLVLVGSMGWGSELSALKDGKPDWLRELGYVPDEKMASILANADLLAQPSIYEGFGMPAAEAAALGTRVLASDIPELREAAGAAGVYVGTSAPEIAQGLLKALEMPRPAAQPGNSWSDAASVMAIALQRAAQAGRVR